MSTCSRVTELQEKEVINIRDGSRLGNVCDAEIDIKTGQILCIVIFGRPRVFGLFGREEDIIIKWGDIEMIGDDTILVNMEGFFGRTKRRNRFLQQIFR